MARPRSFSTTAVVEAAKDAFWARGYAGTAITDLEESTGLNRSSLYQAFGSKERLFGLALDSYIAGFVDPLLSPMERPDASTREVEQFFRRLKAVVRTDRMASQHGCLWVNAIADSACRPDVPDARGPEFRDRLRDAFVNALSHANGRRRSSGPGVQNRARLLMGATFGFWLVARIEAAAAASLCDATVAQVRSWD